MLDREKRIGAVLVMAAVLAVVGFSSPAAAQIAPGGVKEKIDALIASAYQSAAAQLPCKVNSTGKPRILRWQDVDKCLNTAAGRVDWAALSRELDSVRSSVRGFGLPDFLAVVESSLTAHALPYDRTLSVKDENVLLPLTNSVLRFLPEDSLKDLPIIDRSGKTIGTFAGLYSYERTGGLSTANTYRLTLFQYVNAQGENTAPPERLLLDSFGVPWKDARPQPGFRLPADRLTLTK